MTSIATFFEKLFHSSAKQHAVKLHHQDIPIFRSWFDSEIYEPCLMKKIAQLTGAKLSSVHLLSELSRTRQRNVKYYPFSDEPFPQSQDMLAKYPMIERLNIFFGNGSIVRSHGFEVYLHNDRSYCIIYFRKYFVIIGLQLPSTEISAIVWRTYKEPFTDHYVFDRSAIIRIFGYQSTIDNSGHKSLTRWRYKTDWRCMFQVDEDLFVIMLGKRYVYIRLL